MHDTATTRRSLRRNDFTAAKGRPQTASETRTEHVRPPSPATIAVLNAVVSGDARNDLATPYAAALFEQRQGLATPDFARMHRAIADLHGAAAVSLVRGRAELIVAGLIRPAPGGLTATIARGRLQ